ncbi:MAG TPA: right-handed parallel beta-helix repeat-containing protein [Desulfobulbus sp.]|nr:right-handed parallel beta-helix repeat-containing protein [Desulfobulbus sp.]
MAVLVGLGTLVASPGPARATSLVPAMARPAIVMEDNAVFQNNRSGIRVRGSLPVAIRGGKVYQNGRAGINLQDQAETTVSRCEIFANHNAGINLRNATRFLLANSSIHQNGTGGLRIRTAAGRANHTRADVIDSRIFRNHQDGILSWPAGDSRVQLTVRGDRIFRNRKAGIRVENRTFFQAADNRIRANGTAGISSWSDGASPPLLDIYRNTIAFNRGSGINVDSGITGKDAISNNWIHNNLRAGIACGILDSSRRRRINVRILNNTIVGNGSEVEGAGIRADVGSAVEIVNNIIAYNFTSGILTTDCDDYSHNLLFANGEAPNCCTDQGRIPFWVEKIQYASCPGRGSGGLITDPMFVDPDRYNFFLQPDSPARGAGKDIYGTGGLFSAGIDMGATGGPHGFRENRAPQGGAR